VLKLKILKKDYFLEILRVLVKTLINNQKNINNLELISPICEATKRFIPKVVIN